MKSKWTSVLVISVILCSVVGVGAVKFGWELPQIFGMGASKDIFEAVEAGRVSAVKKFLDDGVDVNIRNDAGNTPLISASFPSHARKDVIDLLLDRGADINAKSSFGLTALHEAASQGNKEVVSRLIERGADVNAKDSIESTPLHCAIGEGNSFSYSAILEPGRQDVVELLLRHGAEADPKALELAEYREMAKVIPLLKSSMRQ